MKILCTHPGRYGDCLWALATVRALSQALDTPIDLLLSAPYGTPDFRRLLARQAYLGEVSVAADWSIAAPAPMPARVPPTLPGGYDAVVHLGYPVGPQEDLARAAYRLAREQLGAGEPGLPPLDLDTPWIAAGHSYTAEMRRLVVGFSDEHFELKVGHVTLLKQAFGPTYVRNVSDGPRWQRELETRTFSWIEQAGLIRQARVFVGCCSRLYVLACAVGTPVVLMEPSPARHHDVFYPLGKASQRVRLVLGSDLQPTVDSRHLCQAVRVAIGVAIEARDQARRAGRVEARP